MRITDETLQTLGAGKRTDGSYKIRSHGIEFSLRLLPKEGNKGNLWEFDGYIVTDVEELICLAYRHGLRDGLEDNRDNRVVKRRLRQQRAEAGK